MWRGGEGGTTLATTAFKGDCTATELSNIGGVALEDHAYCDCEVDAAGGDVEVVGECVERWKVDAAAEGEDEAAEAAHDDDAPPLEGLEACIC